MYECAQCLRARGRITQADSDGEVLTVIDIQYYTVPFGEMKLGCMYFVMGPLEVVNVREYFEFAPGEYFAGPLIPVM